MTTTSTGAPGAHPHALTPPFVVIPPAAISRVLSRFDREQLAGFVAVAIDLMDLGDGDPDFENATDVEDDHALSSWAIDPSSGPGCNIADTGEQAYIEWTALHPGTRKAGHNLTAGQEDDEDDDPDHALDEGEPNFVAVKGEGAGCSISDEGGCEHDGREPADEAEREQMLHDVPMLPVVTLDHNIFTDQRQPLGISNLQSSFQVRGEGVRSADSGAVHISSGESWPWLPGVPV